MLVAEVGPRSLGLQRLQKSSLNPQLPGKTRKAFKQSASEVASTAQLFCRTQRNPSVGEATAPEPPMPFLGALRDSAGHEYLELHQTDLDLFSVTLILDLRC